MSPSTAGLRLLCVLSMFLLVSSQENIACPGGFTLQNGNCYKFMQEEYTWFEAQVACWSMGARLTEIDTPEKNNFVATFVQSHGGPVAWIGVTDFAEEGVWILSSSHQPVTNVSQYWAPSEPNDNRNNHSEDCVWVDTNGKWWDAECHMYQKPFVCEMIEGEYTEVVVG